MMNKHTIKNYTIKKLIKRHTAVLLCLVTAAAPVTAAAQPASGSVIEQFSPDSASEESRSDAAIVEWESPFGAAAPAAEGQGALYGIGSVSKVVTAAAVMKLAEEGKLDIDEPLVTYLPEFTMADERYKQITPRMLLNHSSGLMGMTDINASLAGDNDPWNHDHFLRLLENQQLKHEPGDRSIYSNDSFTLAEILVERVSGITFTQFIEQNFAVPLGLENFKSPQSTFDRTLLADVYLGNSELKQENFNVIGSGGLYASMEDLCRFATIFMEGADGSVLAGNAVAEMADNHHQMGLLPPDARTTFQYGLGWDSVDSYPFSEYGIKAVIKGGDTLSYHSNLTVLPEYDLAAAVSVSGTDSHAQLVAQEILLEVLREEGLIPADAEHEPPVRNLEPAKVPEGMLQYAGIYNAGVNGNIHIAFTEKGLTLTPIAVRNEYPLEYIYNTDGVFVSAGEEYFPQSGEDALGTGELSFTEESGTVYLIAQIDEQYPGLGQTAAAMPVAEKLLENPVSESAMEAWLARNDKRYLLVNEKYTSLRYVSFPVAGIYTDERIPGYVGNGIFAAGEAGQRMILSARMMDENTARGYQAIPTMFGRDINDLSVTVSDGTEYLGVNHFRYVDAAAIPALSDLGETVTIQGDTVWAAVDFGMAGKVLHIDPPEQGSWFVYDDHMNCIASSLEQNPRDSIILPENGRLAFAGEAGAVFAIV